MNNILKKSSKILLIILTVLICTATVVSAGLESSQYDSQLATAAKKATLGESDAYFTFNAKSLIGKKVKAADAAGKSSLAPYQRVGEYCIDNRAHVGGASKYTVLNIIDITPEGKVISYKKDGKTIETTDESVVNLLKQMSYIAKESIEAGEGKVSSANCWKVALQSTISNGMGLLKKDLGLDKSFDVTIGSNSKVKEKLKTAKNNSKDKSYQGRFIFLYGNGGQNQIIFGAKETEGESLGDLKIVKNGANKKLENVGFIIKNVDTNEYVSNDYTDKVADYTTDKNKAKEYVTDQNGEINIKGLKLGKYELYETKNSNYGYVVDSSKAISTKVIKSGSNTVQVVNEQVYVKLSGYVWVDEIAEKTSIRNHLYKDAEYEYDDILLDGITVRLKNKTTGETIKTTTTSELGRYTDSRNNGHGEYLFEDVLVKELANYYIEFEYDGLTYTNVIPYIEKDNGSKAVESVQLRTEFNKKFSSVEGRSESTGFTRDANGNEAHNLSYNIDKLAHTATLINNGQYTITANTNEANYSIVDNFTYGQEEIRYINLGLYEREQPDIALVKDLENVRLTVNGYEHTYLYAQRNINAGDYESGFNVGVKFGNEYGKLQYSRAVYKADYEYINENNKDKELKVYVTYKLAMKNQSTNLITLVNSVVDYHDVNYSIVSAGTALDEKGNTTADIEYITENYNEQYNKTVLNVNKEINAQNVETVYVQFALSREAVIKVLNDQENLNNVAEISSYSVFDQNRNVYAGIDMDSNPGNAIPGDITTYEDDTDSAPGLKLEVADAREMTGKVFLDSTSGELMTGQIRQGSGIYEDGEIGIKDVAVTLTENSGSGKVYTATTDENGEFYISDFIPGDYTLTYTWGDETYTVQNYKGTIYNEASRSEDSKWYKQENPRYSDAIDNYQTRLAIDEELKTINKNTQTTINKMDSTTPTMGIGVEYETTYTASTGDRYTYQIKNIDFGIVERARQDIQLTKRIKTLKLTLANGQVIADISIDDEGNVTGEKQYVTYMEPSASANPRNGYLKVELDNELIEGATLETTYEIKVTNISELDYISENYYKYGTIEGDTIKVEITGIMDYLDTEWAIGEQAKWEEKTLESLHDIVADEVYNSESIRDRILLYTESLKGQKLAPTESATVQLDVSKLLSNEDEINLNNEAEVVEVVKDGGSDIISTPGNYIPGEEITEHDSDMAPEIMVTPSTGSNLNIILPITIGLAALIILGVGIIFIKKKAIKND